MTDRGVAEYEEPLVERAKAEVPPSAVCGTSAGSENARGLPSAALFMLVGSQAWLPEGHDNLVHNDSFVVFRLSIIFRKQRHRRTACEE